MAEALLATGMPIGEVMESLRAAGITDRAALREVAGRALTQDPQGAIHALIHLSGGNPDLPPRTRIAQDMDAVGWNPWILNQGRCDLEVFLLGDSESYSFVEHLQGVFNVDLKDLLEPVGDDRPLVVPDDLVIVVPADSEGFRALKSSHGRPNVTVAGDIWIAPLPAPKLTDPPFAQGDLLGAIRERLALFTSGKVKVCHPLGTATWVGPWQPQGTP
jgi:hypothetical protein